MLASMNQHDDQLVMLASNEFDQKTLQVQGNASSLLRLQNETNLSKENLTKDFQFSRDNFSKEDLSKEA